jgi:molybdopterin converting factor small subunit
VTSAASVVIMGGGLLDPVKETSEVYFLPAIAGGL